MGKSLRSPTAAWEAAGSGARWLSSYTGPLGGRYPRMHAQRYRSVLRCATRVWVLSQSDDVVRVCFVGRLEEREGVRTLLEATPWFSNGNGQRFVVSRAGHSLSPGLLGRGCRLLAETDISRRRRTAFACCAPQLIAGRIWQTRTVGARCSTRQRRSPASVEVDMALQRPPPVTAD